jgi:hypothetical protein
MIYISNSNSYNYESELYEPIRQAEFHKHRQIFLSSEPKNADINLKDILDKVDLMIAEVSYPSTGQGIELGRADAAGIPVVCFHKVGSRPSSSVRYITDQLYSYKTTPELIEMITREIEKSEHSTMPHAPKA